jgi:hypothetical protein
MNRVIDLFYRYFNPLPLANNEQAQTEKSPFRPATFNSPYGLPTQDQSNELFRRLALHISNDPQAKLNPTTPFIDTTQLNNDTNLTSYTKIFPVPEGMKEVSRWSLSYALIADILKENDIKASPAAIEAIIDKISPIDFSGGIDKKGELSINNKDGMWVKAARHNDGNGNEIYGYRFTIYPEFQKQVLQCKEMAQEITRSGKIGLSQMGLTARIEKAVGIAYDKYMGAEIKEQLRGLSKEQITAAIAVGGFVGILGRSGAKGALGPAGAALGMSQTLSTSLDLHTFLQMIGDARTEADMDRAAKFLGGKIGEKASDGALAIIGGLASRVVPGVTKNIDRAFMKGVEGARGEYEKIRKSIREGMWPMRYPEPVTVPTHGGGRGRVPEKGILEKVYDPKKTSVDSNGNASGLRFRDDYIEHVSKRDFSVKRKDGIGGAHNLNEFNKYLNEIKIVKRIPHPTLKGVEKIEYKIPTLDKTGKPDGGWSSKIKEKTVYDPAIISDEQMMLWGRQAFAEAQAAGRINLPKRSWEGYAPNGMKFFGYIDAKTGAVRTFFPAF